MRPAIGRRFFTICYRHPHQSFTRQYRFDPGSSLARFKAMVPV
jgi:hypothetical protein